VKEALSTAIPHLAGFDDLDKMMPIFVDNKREKYLNCIGKNWRGLPESYFKPTVNVLISLDFVLIELLRD